MRLWKLLNGLLAACLLAACQKPAVEPAPTRSVKAYTVGAEEGGSVRRYGAQVRAGERSSLSFQVPGRVLELRAGVGDSIRKGAVLAKLDDRPLMLKLQQAQAEVTRSRAGLVDAERRLAAQRTLLDEGFGTRQELDQATAAEATARSALQSAQSALELSQRDAANTSIMAPYSGTVATRTVEPFAEVQAGQVIFEVDGRGEQELVSQVPVAVASRLQARDTLNARVPSEDMEFKVRITSVGQRSTNADTVPVIAVPVARTKPFSPGTYAELAVAIPGGPGHPDIPLDALLPSPDGKTADVFVIDQDMVKRRKVELGAPTATGVLVYNGLKPGEQIVAAGAGFLRDGQQVRVLPPSIR